MFPTGSALGPIYLPWGHEPVQPACVVHRHFYSNCVQPRQKLMGNAALINTHLRRWSCCLLVWPYKEPQHTCKHKKAPLWKTMFPIAVPWGGITEATHWNQMWLLLLQWCRCIPEGLNKFPACSWKWKAAKENQCGLFVVKENCLWTIGGYWQAVTANIRMAVTKKYINIPTAASCTSPAWRIKSGTEKIQIVGT